MRNAYVDLCLQVQAVRRSLEGIRTPLAPAIGVAASLYPHQVSNVQRVLTDVRVRHLLADEVGLGKTVQALMVLNALRSQRIDLRVLVIVPDQLVTQWRDEIMTRSHSAPIDEDHGVEGIQYIRLAWEAQLRMNDEKGAPLFSLADINSDRYDVLVVDELHHLRTDVQDRIVRVAAGFEHVLILTATPEFQKVRRRAQIFTLLEPERVALARRRIVTGARGTDERLEISDGLSEWPEWAMSAVVDELLERDRVAAESVDWESITVAALTHCAYRRVIRTRRVDYMGILPRRQHRPVVVEPLDAEVERQSLMWKYFDYLDDLTRKFDPILLAKRVILSPPSLEQRVDFFRRQGHERAGLLERVKPLVHRSQGDSRADALVDLLQEVWAEDPTERILVAAQDNLTVDYLFDLVQGRLPVIGPLSGRVPLVAAKVRQGQTTAAVEDLGGFGNETNENLESFQRGDAQVLFAPEAAQVGLNLQCARVLVLYSVPWHPAEVEQWIGRLDRIGNIASFSKDGKAKRVDVYTIVQRGLVDEKVVGVLQHSHVFERSVNLIGTQLVELTERIGNAVLRPERISWRELENDTESMAVEDEAQELESALRKHLPWTARSADAVRLWLESMPPEPPVLGELPEHSARGPKAWDRAFEGMVNLLRFAGEYHVVWNTEPETGNRFRTLWYRFGELGAYGKPTVRSRVVFPIGANPEIERSPRYAHAFITRRGDIGTPPKRDVIMELNHEHVRRYLRFLSFGDTLHDELINGWLPQNEDLVTLGVTLLDDHALWKHGGSGLYLLRLSVLDPGTVLIGRGVKDRLLGANPPFTKLEKLVELIRCACEADIRWIRGQFAARMSLDVRRWKQGNWVKVGAKEAVALLNPMAYAHSKGIPRSEELHLSATDKKTIEAGLCSQRQTDSMAARSAWSGRIPEFEKSLSARLAVIAEEASDSLALANEELRRVDDALETARKQGYRAQITRAENVRKDVVETVHMVQVVWDERSRWLRECREGVLQVLPRERLAALIQARKGIAGD